ncbi:sulfite exporter TauE/SafE family protein [Enterococcus cecorum]|uniref:Probable membrane transporter protein n=1 Tax=Enterococcus cecorum TaxID=44008 RepID=A0A200I2J0_9ENTE|nr:sulfite exporter TauE/SafE family protein [Enterococcus cecorum]OUZ19274.1 hypothetical protein A5869_000923 [Enterococcus cecorum]
MKRELIYFIVIIIANTIGSISGIGGGIIIKPIFDYVAFDSVMTTSFYSSVAVFVMSIVSTIRQVQAGQKLDFINIANLAWGSILGGYLGSLTFDYLLSLSGTKSSQLVQIVLTMAMLIFSLLSTKNIFKHYYLIKIRWYIFFGVFLGFLSSFLGIGGGPINVAVFIIFFGIPIKIATIYSITTILFSQISKIISLLVLSHFNNYSVTVLIYIVAAGLIGGLLGAKFSRILTADKVAIVFQTVVLLVLFLNFYNLYTLLER